MNLKRRATFLADIDDSGRNPARAQPVAPTVLPADSAASIPDFSSIRWHPSLPGFEPACIWSNFADKPIAV
jgi:hypothetical protein